MVELTINILNKNRTTIHFSSNLNLSIYVMYYHTLSMCQIAHLNITNCVKHIYFYAYLLVLVPNAKASTKATYCGRKCRVDVVISLDGLDDLSESIRSRA